MAKLKVEQFVDVLKRSGLVDDERLNQALSGIDESVKDSGIIASSLTKAGLLTEWQSEKLLQGKHKGFYLGKYKLLNHIGTGGMGSVYLAEHRIMRHRVAIKLLPNHMAATTSYLERFHQEARASASLNHPNMVKAHDVDHEENLHFLVMEYVDGVDLQALVSRNGTLPYRDAADYIRQAADGLAYAHRSGLIHRDIKPANLLVDKSGTVKILDMGLARFTDETQGSLTMAYDQKMIGTVDYLSPEQALDSHKVDARTDIYSLGCTLYFLLTGDAPFPQGTIPQRLMQHQTAEPTDIRETRPDAPPALVAICAKMMAKKVADRYQSADEVGAALTAWLNNETAGPTGGGFLGTGTTLGGKKYPAPESSYAPPSGPSLNEDLDLAPLDDELEQRGARARKPGDSSSSSGIASKSGVQKSEGSGVKKTGSSPGHKPDSSVTKNGAAGGSGIRRSGAVPVLRDGAAGAAHKEVAKEDLLDDLLAAPQHIPPDLAAPTISGGHKTRHCEQERPLWVVALMGLGAGCALIALIMFAIWYTGGF